MNKKKRNTKYNFIFAKNSKLYLNMHFNNSKYDNKSFNY